MDWNIVSQKCCGAPGQIPAKYVYELNGNENPQAVNVEMSAAHAEDSILLKRLEVVKLCQKPHSLKKLSKAPLKTKIRPKNSSVRNRFKRKICLNQEIETWSERKKKPKKTYKEVTKL